MELKKVLGKILLIAFIVNFHNSYSQASWTGKFYFSLKDCKGKVIKFKDLKKNNISFYSFNAKNKKIRFDSINNSFTIESHFISESRTFYITTKTDTLKISFPALDKKGLFIKKPIQLKSSKISFISPTVIDFMTNNRSTNRINNYEIFYLDNEIKQENLTSKDSSHLKKHRKKFILISVLE